MKSYFGFVVLGSLVSLANFANASCPAWIKDKQSLPLCPETSLLSETYPAAALVVSDRSTMGYRDESFPAEVIAKYLKAQPDRAPLFVLPVDNETMTVIYRKLEEMPGTPEQKALWKKQIVQVKGKSYPWQQDYFESFANPRTGKMEIREVGNYGETETFNAIAAELNKCGISTGKVLKNREGVSGTYGGNIEALPGGICMVGNDSFETHTDWSDYVDQFCGKDPDMRIEVPTYFMTVGHTDEIVKVLPSNSSGSCGFSVSIASPNKALELLKSQGKDLFIQNPEKVMIPFRDANNKGMQGPGNGLKTVCRAVRGKDAVPRTRGDSGVSFLEWITQPRTVHASQDVCASITNAEVYNTVMQDQQIREYNQGIQKEMDRLKAVIRQKLVKKMPQCKVDFIDVPNLFFGGAVVSGEARPLSAATGDSILPNPANALSAGNTVISPEPQNKAFKNYISTEYAKRGIKADFVNTYSYGHVGGGNLHCATHTIHACKGRGGQ
ncbi:protein-arginine deiminase family protein [Bdellovibrio sp. HCB274]|uniref:protein-arginine deiminase family protein n=1 Tax=Bdellovibrio sp. HCB274 TaxID=3394361 RepID=UPI0039B48EA7